MNDSDRDGTRSPTRYYGKYRGKVVVNLDPEGLGRIMATAPDVQGLVPLSWATPCVPLGGITIPGFPAGTFMAPAIGANVWIEFEQGDPQYPIWSGGFWSNASQVPLAANIPPAIPPGQNIVLQTPLKHMLAISDAVPGPILDPMLLRAPGTGGIILSSPTGAMIVVNDAGIFINNGQGASINLVGTAVLINKDALVVLK